MNRTTSTATSRACSRALRAVCMAAAMLLTGTTAASAQAPLKVFISSDMEGVAGAVTGDQLGPGGFEYARFREFMTAEVLAAIDGARAAGATEILVADAHGNGQNLLIEQLPDDVMVVRSWPRPLMMMQGIDSTFDAAILLGHHSSTTNPEGVRAHTMSSANLAAVRLNGIEMPEAGINAAIAGHFGVPVVMISGDDAAVEEAQRIIGDIEGAVVKWAISFHSAKTLTPQAARALIRERTRTAVARHDDIAPYTLEGPITLELTFKNYRPAEMMAYLPNVERVDAHTVRFIGRDMREVSSFLEFAMTYEPGLTP
ncbi:MAG TPA: M55 family metallopeptidase [Longimicrobiales bacterium]|nr:M55 family metallopeptidase [Longimicrobiales bacterium]